MVKTLDIPILGLENAFPEHIYLLRTGTKLNYRYGCYQFGSLHGIACFSTEGGAYDFANNIDVDGLVTIKHTFDEAREIVKSKPPILTCLMLLDNINSPKIHYVR